MKGCPVYQNSLNISQINLKGVINFKLSRKSNYSFAYFFFNFIQLRVKQKKPKEKIKFRPEDNFKLIMCIRFSQNGVFCYIHALKTNSKHIIYFSHVHVYKIIISTISTTFFTT